MIAAISVDIDTLNDYAYTYGKNYQKVPDPVYTIAVPRLLEMLDKYKIKATFFVVGRDLNIDEHFKVIKTIAQKGHEIANHTQNHLHNFETLTFSKQEKEIVQCHRLVEEKLGLSMIGFRAPGYNLNKGTFKVLSGLNYVYDSSMFPTSLLPFLKLIVMFKAKGNHKSAGGGQIASIFSKASPYKLNNQLIEIPITVTPILRFPFMGTFNVVTGKNLLELSFRELKLFKKSINYEIHPIEFLNDKSDNIPGVFKSHPGLKIPLDKKIEIYDTLFSNLKTNYEMVTLGDQAKNL